MSLDKEIIDGPPKNDAQRVLLLMTALVILAEALTEVGLFKCPICDGSGIANLDLGKTFVYSGPCPLVFVLPHDGALN